MKIIHDEMVHNIKLGVLGNPYNFRSTRPGHFVLGGEEVETGVSSRHTLPLKLYMFIIQKDTSFNDFFVTSISGGDYTLYYRLQW